MPLGAETPTLARPAVTRKRYSFGIPSVYDVLSKMVRADGAVRKLVRFKPILPQHMARGFRQPESFLHRDPPPAAL